MATPFKIEWGYKIAGWRGRFFVPTVKGVYKRGDT